MTEMLNAQAFCKAQVRNCQLIAKIRILPS